MIFNSSPQLRRPEYSVCRAYVGAGQLIAHRLRQAPPDLDISDAMSMLTILEIASIATAILRGLHRDR